MSVLTVKVMLRRRGKMRSEGGFDDALERRGKGFLAESAERKDHSCTRIPVAALRRCRDFRLRVP
jgi:hypothetical protein